MFGWKSLWPSTMVSGFCYISNMYIYIYIYCHHESSRTPQHSKWNCVGTNTHAHAQPRCMSLNFEHTKNSNRSEKIPRRRKSNSNLLIISQNPRKILRSPSLPLPSILLLMSISSHMSLFHVSLSLSLSSLSLFFSLSPLSLFIFLSFSLSRLSLFTRLWLRDPHAKKQQGGEGRMSRTPFAVKQSTLEKRLLSKNELCPRPKRLTSVSCFVWLRSIPTQATADVALHMTHVTHTASAKALVGHASLSLWTDTIGNQLTTTSHLAIAVVCCSNWYRTCFVPSYRIPRFMPVPVNTLTGSRMIESESTFSWSASTWFCMKLENMMTTSLFHFLVAANTYLAAMFRHPHKDSKMPRKPRKLARDSQTTGPPAHLLRDPHLPRVWGPMTLHQMQCFRSRGGGGASQESGGQSAPDRTAQQRHGRIGKVTRPSSGPACHASARRRRKETGDDNATSWMEDQVRSLPGALSQRSSFCECATQSGTWPRASDWAWFFQSDQDNNASCGESRMMRYARRRQRRPLPSNLHAVTVKVRMQPHPKVLRYLESLLEWLSGKTSPNSTGDRGEGEPTFHLHVPVKARLQEHFRAISRALLRVLDDSSTIHDLGPHTHVRVAARPWDQSHYLDGLFHNSRHWHLLVDPLLYSFLWDQLHHLLNECHDFLHDRHLDNPPSDQRLGLGCDHLPALPASSAAQGNPHSAPRSAPTHAPRGSPWPLRAPRSATQEHPWSLRPPVPGSCAVKLTRSERQGILQARRHHPNCPGIVWFLSYEPTCRFLFFSYRSGGLSISRTSHNVLIVNEKHQVTLFLYVVFFVPYLVTCALKPSMCSENNSTSSSSLSSARRGRAFMITNVAKLQNKWELAATYVDTLHLSPLVSHSCVSDVWSCMQMLMFTCVCMFISPSISISIFKSCFSRALVIIDVFVYAYVLCLCPSPMFLCFLCSRVWISSSVYVLLMFFLWL